MSKKILVIAGGTWQVPLIKKAKALGYTVINSNLYEDSIGFRFADAGEVADVKDMEKNLEFAQKHQVDGVLTDQSDIAVPTVAYVASQMGLPTIGESLAELFTNKYKMREFCKAHGFLYPEFQLFQSAEEVRAFFEAVGKTIIIKPLDSQSSRGVYVIEKDSDVEALFTDSCQYSRDGRSVIAERYIVGTEFTVDGMVTKAGHRSLCISQKDHFAYNESIASELFFTNENPDFDYAQLRKANDALVDATGLPFGLTHAEYKYEDGQFYLIEIAARGGGTKISSDIVPIISGVDNYQYLLSCAMGHPMEMDTALKDAYKNRAAVLKFLDVNSQGRQVTAIEGVEEITANPQVVDFGLEFKVGDVVGNAMDDRSRVGYYIAYEESPEKLRALMKKIEKTLVIRF